MICDGCGGVVGRDCFNPQECVAITRDMMETGQFPTQDSEIVRRIEEECERVGSDSIVITLSLSDSIRAKAMRDFADKILRIIREGRE